MVTARVGVGAHPKSFGSEPSTTVAGWIFGSLLSWARNIQVGPENPLKNAPKYDPAYAQQCGK